MAEVAAGALVAEQIVSTSVEVGVGAAIARPTLPIKTASTLVKAEESPSSKYLTRSHHSLTIIKDKAYLFGGISSDGMLCGANIHEITIPSLSNKDQSPQTASHSSHPVPAAGANEAAGPPARREHAACSALGKVVIHGGRQHEGPLEEPAGRLWLWDPETAQWSRLDPEGDSAPKPRYGHSLFVNRAQTFLVLHDGKEGQQTASSSGTWLFDLDRLTWTRLPDCPRAPLAAAMADDVLYSTGAEFETSGIIHTLNLKDFTPQKSGLLKWESIKESSPRPRTGAKLLPIRYSLGRNYLFHLLGQPLDALPPKPADEDVEVVERLITADLWSLQIPAAGASLAQAKDKIRDKITSSGSREYGWDEVQVEEQQRPSPRSFFGADVTEDGNTVLLWGGQDSNGEVIQDGWVFRTK